MSEPKKTESFAGNVMKYSIATYLGFGISGAALIIKGVLPAESYAVPASFMAYTMSLMNVGMLGFLTSWEKLTFGVHTLFIGRFGMYQAVRRASRCCTLGW